jgi:hypothetical protein
VGVRAAVRRLPRDRLDRERSPGTQPSRLEHQRAGSGAARTLSGPCARRRLIAINDKGAPHWPLLVERVLHGKTAIRLTFVAFDLLRVDGHDVSCNPWSQRRTLLEGIWVERHCARLADVYDDGHALYDAVLEHGLEGIVAKRRSGLYGSGYRGWIKVKNPAYWRRESEIELMQRRRERFPNPAYIQSRSRPRSEEHRDARCEPPYGAVRTTLQWLRVCRSPGGTRYAPADPAATAAGLAGLFEKPAPTVLELHDPLLGLLTNIPRDLEGGEIRRAVRSGTSKSEERLLDRHVVRRGKVKRIRPEGAVDPLRVHGLRSLPLAASPNNRRKALRRRSSALCCPSRSASSTSASVPERERDGVDSPRKSATSRVVRRRPVMR